MTATSAPRTGPFAVNAHGNRFRRAREASGLSLGQAARVLEVSVTWLSAQETEPPSATEGQVASMAKAYGTSVAWLQGVVPEIPAGFRQTLDEAALSPHDRDVVRCAKNAVRSVLRRQQAG